MENNKNLSEYRQRYRAEFIGAGYNGWLHLAFTVSASLAVIACSLLQLREPTWYQWLTVPIAFIYTNLMEYWGHRGPMHHRRKWLGGVYQRHTLRHHRFFRHDAMAFDGSRDFHAVLFPPVLVVFFLLLTVVPSALLVHWLLGVNVAWLYVAAVFAYFLNYELLHFAYHLREDSWIGRLPGMAALRRLHTQHHDPRLMQKYNFNITYPIGDWLFGTLYRPDKAVDGRPSEVHG
ncbi:Fatty acid hydroxylase superfamily protein [Microbulbifer donghaiensis]|uniref:Fatty acid hydroxylase superfamily protein n=1 Tax=Microbulbifer donghaiensis TaxID=494016 RepID=A0A1M5CSL6_9GAMM|nr:sterol desaturase family protein [Microbulbifer donghaiensis]SHF57721.1 Fatty acid hydroxylase superfamily protein [Microbulbifer donghaiensis]